MFAIHGIISGFRNRPLWKITRPFHGFSSAVGDAVGDVLGSGTQDALRGFDNAVLQPTKETALDAAEDTYNGASQWLGNALGSVTGSDKLKNVINPPTWDEWGRPGQAFYNEINQVNKYLPTKTLRQYAPAIEGALLNFVPGVGWALSAGFNTLYNAGAMQANQKGMNWGDVGKNALMNFGTAAAGKLASGALSNANKAAATKSATNIIGSGAAPETSNFLSLAGQAAPQTTSNIGVGAGNLVQGVPSTMASFSAAPSSVSAAADVNRAAGAQSTPETQASSTTSLEKPGLVDKAYTNTMSNLSTEGQTKANLQGLGASMLTDTLSPKGQTPITGVGAEGTDLNTGEAYQPTGSDVFKAFGGDVVNSTDLISADQYKNMQDELGLNAGMQLNATRDIMLPTGQYEPDPNTPYSDQVGDIGKSYSQSQIDLANQVNQENYNRYNTKLMNSLMEANPDRVTPDVFQGWLANPDTRPQEIMSYFQPAPQMLPAL